MTEGGATIFDRVQELVAARVPVAVATIVRGDGVGSKLLVLPDGVEGEGSFANLGLGQVVECEFHAAVPAGVPPSNALLLAVRYEFAVHGEVFGPYPVWAARDVGDPDLVD